MIEKIIIDAGVEHTRIRLCAAHGETVNDLVLPSNGDFHQAFSRQDLIKAFSEEPDAPPIFVTGKLAEVVRDVLGRGEIILPAAALWAAATEMVSRERNGCGSLALIDLSASGYLLIGVDKDGQLRKDMLVVNPRCGAGSGANIDRVLQKLAIGREEVDDLLVGFLGEAGREKRVALQVRADRCGVFSSSATISDKNQGIPLDYALAVTLKSEVLKCCKKLSSGFDKVQLTGGVFAWTFTRDCASDYLRELGVREIAYDTSRSLLLDGVHHLVERVGMENFFQPERRLKKRPRLMEYPAFATLKDTFASNHLYRRLPDEAVTAWTPQELEVRPVLIGLDVGSTMAKIEIADAETEETLFLDAYSNHGDTIETIKHIFRDLQSRGVARLNIGRIGITGSARYQVQEALRQIYPQLAKRILVLVENYAHARGSIDLARTHISWLKNQGIEDVNEEFFILVDIGGEDTKLSTISLRRGELFDNAMNVKCSAGTGSLMDSLRSLFGIEDVARASGQAFHAGRAYAINATCAVFLMENARKLQAQGIPRDEILASANWAIVENMARTLWSQVDLPENAVALLHGQTMLSDPLPLAVTHRMQEYTGSSIYCLVPPHPGHRACRGLIRTMAQERLPGAESCSLDVFIEQPFQKKVIQCHGAACSDRQACCNRTSLSGTDMAGKRFSFTLGGCTAINELLARKGDKKKKTKPATDTYKEIWQFIDERLPRTEDENRLVIPRSFAVSEWAYFFSRVFHYLDVPVHVDNVLETDLIEAQPFFNIDTCAPQIGAVGQFRRLASEPHGVILAPQLEYLPTRGPGLGRTCTINQGGIMVAKNLAEVAHPEARFHLFNVDFKEFEAASLAHQLHLQLQPVFAHYGISPALEKLLSAVERAMADHRELRAQAAERAADIVETALGEGRSVAVVVGREYILNPGIFDSHVGRLLRDKNIAALPAYLFDLELDPDYAHLYWRNPHFIVTVLAAIAERRLHERLLHPRLQALFRHMETRSPETLIPVVQVSAFRCGPDSVTTPVVAEIMKKRPFLLIQSDAVIKELAHLENRMNTYVKQLELGLHGELKGADGEPFEIGILENFTNTRELDKQRDVIYFPTLADNRVLTSVMRGAGFTCLDNYEDESYDLGELVREGRKVVGDAVCAPLAAVYGDILRAVEDFSRRKEAGDPLVAGKNRILIFNNKGSGPCRQGQYSEVHKLFAWQRFGTRPTAHGDQQRLYGDALLQFMVGEEEKGYNTGVEEWVMVRMFQGVILQGIFHTLLFEGGAQCSSYAEYQQLLDDYRRMKKEVYRLQEKHIKPSRSGHQLARQLGHWPWAGTVVKYFAYRLHQRGLQRALGRFARKWVRPRRKGDACGRMKIHIEGEAYMRIAQAEEIFRLLLATLGFQRFILHYSPLWCYLEYLLEGEILSARTKAGLAGKQLKEGGAGEREALRKELQESRKALSKAKGARGLLRQVLARPLYRAAGVPLPEPMREVLMEAEAIMPTLRPGGELGPYVGEALLKLRHGCDLFLNVAPEGCMVSSMGEVLTPKILQTAGDSDGRLQNLFSSDGEIDEEALTVALLKVMGPEKYYQRRI